MENCSSLITEPQRAVPMKAQIMVRYNDSFLVMILQVSPKRNEKGEIKRADMMAESILNLEFKHTGLLYMNIYVRSVINLCETVPHAVAPKVKWQGWIIQLILEP